MNITAQKHCLLFICYSTPSMHIQKTQALFVHVLTDDLLSAYQVLSIVPGTIHIPLTHPLPLSLSHAHTHTHKDTDLESRTSHSHTEGW
jgi:hypothetical protein